MHTQYTKETLKENKSNYEKMKAIAKGYTTRKGMFYPRDNLLIIPEI